VNVSPFTYYIAYFLVSVSIGFRSSMKAFGLFADGMKYDFEVSGWRT